MRRNTARGEGGAVFNTGTASLRSSVISGSTSQAATGGGLANHGTITLTTTVVLDNTAAGSGGDC
ncbi:hypothetical protein ABT382_26405 [Streptomyces pharetrae]|uniref:hypothetical protein n=1 Tax=Streptomyces pharetrae TaxID=291370 RepID=UPI0033561B11